MKQFELDRIKLLHQSKLKFDGIQQVNETLSENELLYKEIIMDLNKYINESNFNLIIDTFLYVI